MQETSTKEKLKRLLYYALFLFLALTTQEIVLSGIRIGGVCAFVLPAVAVAVGMFEGAGFGTVFSLIMGIFADMIFTESTVTFTLLFPALAFAAGFVAQFFINRSFIAFLLLALLALGFRNIRLGPTLPAFVSTGVARTLVERFGLCGIGSVGGDVKSIMG